jgi:hypothetical protein
LFSNIVTFVVEFVVDLRWHLRRRNQREGEYRGATQDIDPTSRRAGNFGAHDHPQE